MIPLRLNSLASSLVFKGNDGAGNVRSVMAEICEIYEKCVKLPYKLKMVLWNILYQLTD